MTAEYDTETALALYADEVRNSYKLLAFILLEYRSTVSDEIGEPKEVSLYESVLRKVCEEDPDTFYKFIFSEE